MSRNYLYFQLNSVWMKASTVIASLLNSNCLHVKESGERTKRS